MARFLATPEATHLLFSDADIGFDPQQVFRLLDFGADVSAGSYPVKGLDWEKMRRVFQAGAPKPESRSGSI